MASFQYESVILGRDRVSDPNWHILGAGAIGCLFGAALARQGYGATLILRNGDERDSTAVIVEHAGQSDTVQLPVFSAGNDKVITHLLVATKAYDVHKAVSGVAHHLARDCQVLLMVNGMGLVEQLHVKLPHLQIYTGTTTEGAYRIAAQHIQHAGRGETRIGRKGQATPPDWFEQWSSAMQPCTWDHDIETALWRKLVVNCVINPLTALHRCPNGDLARRPQLAEQVSRLADEVAYISSAAGFTEIATTLPHTLNTVINATASNRSSMLQDVENAQPTEIDYITGYLLKVAKQHGIDAPLNSALLERISQSDH